MVTQLSAASTDSHRYAEQGSDPSTPASTFWRIYFKSTGAFIMDDAGAVIGPLNLSGPTTTTDNGIVRWNGVAGLTIQDSSVTINDNNQLVLPNSATYPPLNVTERSSAPSTPSSGDIYLDDGTNTASGNPGLRRYTGAAWEDINTPALVSANGTYTAGSNYDTTSTSYSDVDATNVKQTVTLNGGDVLVIFHMVIEKVTANSGSLRITDGTNNSNDFVVTTTSGRTPITIFHVFSGLAAGSTTFKLQYKSSDTNTFRVYNVTDTINWSVEEIA